MWLFFFGSVYVMDNVYGFAYVETALNSRDEAYLILKDMFFDMLLHSVCHYFTEDFYFYVHHGYWLEIFFFSSISARFLYQNNFGLIK